MAPVCSAGAASQHVSITNSTFADMSGGAIKIGNLDDVRALVQDPRQWDVDYVIHNNDMRESAVEWHGAACIFAGYVAQTNISYNSIKDAGYTGISLGWGWGHGRWHPKSVGSNVISRDRFVPLLEMVQERLCVYGNVSLVARYPCQRPADVCGGQSYHRQPHRRSDACVE